MNRPSPLTIPLLAALSALLSCQSESLITQTSPGPHSETIPGWSTSTTKPFHVRQIEPARQTDLVAPQVYRGEALAVAEAYRQHHWAPRSANVRHSRDAQGIRVDTPDFTLQGYGGGFWEPGTPTTGVPYRWGGFDSLEQFENGLARGLAAGDIYTQTKRDGLESQVSHESVGIDCSGLISRCWRLERPWSTRTLPELCDELDSLDELRPGDILNVHNHHVMLFVSWLGPDKDYAEVYEVGATPVWRVHRHGVQRALIEAMNYRPLRYRGIREDPSHNFKPWL